MTNDARVPARSLAVGVPAAIRENRSDPELIELMAKTYCENAARYARRLRRLD